MPTESAGKSVSKEAIVGKAVDLMAERGLAAVSLRRIAAELGVSAPTLYWYIADKRELLDSVAEHLLRRNATGMASRPAKGQPWWDWLEERCRALFEAMIAVRDAPQVIAGNRPTLESLAGIDTALGELVAVGFTAAEAQRVFFVLGGYIGGMALEWQSEAAREEDGVDDSALRAALSDAERYPHIAAAAKGRALNAPMETFDYGLKLLINGLRARHQELT